MNNHQIGNSDVPWNDLSNRFWDSYSKKNYANPVTGDLEGLFCIIQSMRGKKDGNFVEVGTGSAPQYALAAAMAGMGNITVSDTSKGAITWIKKEILGDVTSSTTQTWADIICLLSSFKDKKELEDYCSDTGFDKRLYNWKDLTQAERQEWFDDRRNAVASNGVKDHFLDYKRSPRRVLKEMYEQGKFSIKQFSVLSPPADMIGTADVVAAMYVSANITEKPSENCEALLQSCKLAKPKTGIVNFGHEVNADWKYYKDTTLDLPSLSRSSCYFSVASDLLLKDIRQAGADNAAQIPPSPGSDSWSMPTDRRPDFLTNISGIPKDVPYKNGGEMLQDLHVHILEAAKELLTVSPGRRNISADSVWKNLRDIEKAVGITSEMTSDKFLKNSPEGKRQIMAERIDAVIKHIKSPANARNVTTMNNQDELFNSFLHGLHMESRGRGGRSSRAL